MSALSDIEVLGIERACERLVFEFFRCLDTRNEAGLEQVLTEDVTYARPLEPTKVITGRDVLIKAFTARPKRFGRHLCSNMLITVDSADRAHGTHHVMLISGPEENPDATFGYKADARQLIGEFDDQFVKTSQGWRISSRRGRIVMQTG